MWDIIGDFGEILDKLQREDHMNLKSLFTSVQMPSECDKILITQLKYSEYCNYK